MKIVRYIILIRIILHLLFLLCYTVLILGTIELREMSEIIETLYEMEGVSKVRGKITAC